MKKVNSTSIKTYKNPVCVGADPYILLHEGKYYLYATTSDTEGYRVSVSLDLINWEDKGFCLKKGDVKGEVLDGGGFFYGFWAPEVIFYHDKFYMIYTVDDHLGIAVSDSPLGPFKQEIKEWVFEKNAIDGHLFVDEDDTVYLIYRWREKNRIAGVKMNPDMRTVDESSDTILITPAEYDWELVKKDEVGTEGPFLIKHGGYYYLSYSANDFQNVDYAVGYAVSDKPLGKYVKYEGNPILRRRGRILGTGHHSFTTSKDKERLICVYHCHNSEKTVEPRMTCIDLTEFRPNEKGGADILVINGPTYLDTPSIS